MYSPNNKILWDSWLIKVNDTYHVFYLQAFPTKNTENRHDNNVSIGHAVSIDLKNWKELPTALEPGKGDEWDNLSLWTGSVIKKGNVYYMFYTGRNKKQPNIQKIGMAASVDLINWKKKPNPILEANEKYYQINSEKNKLGTIGTWRDPYVFQDPVTNKYYMTISAREKSEKREYNGCIAIAKSDNLLKWNILPPILAPKVFDEMETSQVIFHKGIYYLFFSTYNDSHEPHFAKNNESLGGLHCYYSKNLFGDYKPVKNNGVVIGNEKKIYDIRLLHDKDDSFTAIGWLNETKTGEFVGKLSSPFKIKINS